MMGNSPTNRILPALHSSAGCCTCRPLHAGGCQTKWQHCRARLVDPRRPSTAV